MANKRVRQYIKDVEVLIAMPDRAPRKVASLRWTILLITTALLACLSSLSLFAQTNEPITKDGLLGALQYGQKHLARRKTAEWFINFIEQSGVAFQSTLADEQAIRLSGSYLEQKGMDKLIDAVRNNYRAPGNSPFRITYIILESRSIDLFLRSKIKRSWATEASGPYVIVHNNAFTTISRLVGNFSERFTDGAFIVDKGENTIADPQLASLYAHLGMKLFVGSGNVELPMIWVEEVPVLVNLLNDPDQSWRAFWSGGEILKTHKRARVNDYIVFRKFADRRDFALLESSPLQKFYSYITKKYMPPDFGYFQLTLISPNGGEDCGAHASPQIRSEAQGFFYGPTLSLRIALIENTSGKTMKIGDFILKENNSDRLRKREEDQSVLTQLASQRQNLFPTQDLMPGRKIAIPMEMIVERDYENPGLIESDPVPAEAVERLKKSGGLVYRGGSDNVAGSINVTTDALENILKRTDVNFTTSEKYVYGPSVNIEAIEIDNRDYPVRQFDPKHLLITSEGDNIGSCPYLYTYSQERNSWINEGVILYGVNEKSKEATELKPLRRFDGRVLIKELDAEESFIDSLLIKAIAPDGREMLLHPQHEKLGSADGDYLRLKQGEQLIVNFDVPKDFVAQKYAVIVKGYYIPYKRASVRSKPKVGSVR